MTIPGTGKVRELPEVGAVVRVVTRWYNSYFLTAKTQPFVDHVYEGTVLPAERGDKLDVFNMTCAGINMRNRQIPMRNVVKIEYLKGKGIKSVLRAFKVKSGDKTYIVTLAGDRCVCDCLGFKYRHKCKHSNAVLKQVKGKK